MIPGLGEGGHQLVSHPCHIWEEFKARTKSGICLKYGHIPMIPTSDEKLTINIEREDQYNTKGGRIKWILFHSSLETEILCFMICRNIIG